MNEYINYRIMGNYQSENILINLREILNYLGGNGQLTRKYNEC